MAKIAIHGTAGTLVTTATLDRYFSKIQIVNRGSHDIFFTTDGVTDPTVDGDDIFVVAAGSSIVVGNRGPVYAPIYYDDQMTDENQRQTPANTVVKLIASANTSFSVQGSV